MFGSLGFPEIMLILGLAMLLFGPKKLPEIGRSLGKGIREFKKGTSGLMDSLNPDIKEPPVVNPPMASAQSAAKPASEEAKPQAAQPTPRPEPAKATVIDFEKDGEQGP